MEKLIMYSSLVIVMKIDMFCGDILATLINYYNSCIVGF